MGSSPRSRLGSLLGPRVSREACPRAAAENFPTRSESVRFRAAEARFRALDVNAGRGVDLGLIWGSVCAIKQENPWISGLIRSFHRTSARCRSGEERKRGIPLTCVPRLSVTEKGGEWRVRARAGLVAGLRGG